MNRLIFRYEFDPDIGPGPFDLETRSYHTIRSKPPVNQWLGRDGQLHRSDMFIVHESKQNRLKPHRGGMVASGVVHAAPMELERILGCAVTIDMSLLRSWTWIGQGRKAAPERPNRVGGGGSPPASHTTGHAGPRPAVPGSPCGRSSTLSLPRCSLPSARPIGFSAPGTRPR